MVLNKQQRIWECLSIFQRCTIRNTKETIRSQWQRTSRTGRNGYFSAQDELLDDPGTHALTADFLQSHLWQFLPVPLEASGASTKPSLELWTDYTQEVSATTEPCTTALDCTDRLCM